MIVGNGSGGDSFSYKCLSYIVRDGELWLV